MGCMLYISCMERPMPHCMALNLNRYLSTLPAHSAATASPLLNHPCTLKRTNVTPKDSLGSLVLCGVCAQYAHIYKQLRM